MHLPNCELQYHKRRNSEYSAPQLDCHDKHYFLTQRGAYQAWRNSSGEMYIYFYADGKPSDQVAKAIVLALQIRNQQLIQLLKL